MDMDISESEYRLPDSCGMSIDLLDSIEWTLTHTTRERRYLVDTDDTIVCYDEYIEFIIEPIQKYKSQSNNPKEGHASPKKCSASEEHNALPICKKYSWSNKKDKHVHKMKYQNNPVSVECHYDFFSLSEEGDVFLLDHVVIWGALK